MSLPLTILLLIVVLAGVSMQFAGLYFRRGERPSCRQCAYDLSSHLPANCPECNASLTQNGAIAIGERRKRLAWLGTLVLAVGVLSLSYLLIQSPKFDQLKPVGLLRLEMTFVNDRGDSRIIKEFNRRVSSAGASAAERRSIGKIAVALASKEAPSQQAYDLLANAATAGAISAEQASPLILDLISRWPDEMRSSSTFSSRNFLHSKVLGALIQSCGIEFEALRPILQIGLRNSIQREPAFAYEMLCADLIWNWWDSPSSSGLTEHELLELLYKDSPELQLEVRPRVVMELATVPYLIRFALPPSIGVEGHAVKLTQSIARIRVHQNGQTFEPRHSSSSRTSMTSDASRSSGFPSGAMGSPARIEGLQPGKAEFVLEIHVTLAPESLQPNGATQTESIAADVPPIIDRTITLRSEFEVVTAAEGAIALLMPGEGDTPGPRALLEELTVSPLYYNTLPASGSDGPWQIEFHPSRIRHDQQAQIDTLWPEVNVAFRVEATQGGHTWQIGALTARNILRNRYSTLYIQPGLTPLRKNESGKFEWDQPVPDFAEPVRLRLVPDPELAQRTVDMTSIYGIKLDLGEFQIVRVEGRHGRVGNAGDYLPIPSLEEESD